MRVYTKRMAELRESAVEAAGVLRGKAVRTDETGELHPAMLELLWERGFMTMRVPKDFGGCGWSLPECCLAVEELARGCGAAALMVLLQAMAASAVRKHVGDKQKKEWFDRMVNGRQVCAFALSEPAPGNEGRAEVTTAKKRKTEYLIQGRKTFVSGARDADMVIVFAITNRRAGLKKALSAFMVPAGTTGMLPGLELSRSGLRGVPAVELVFEGCRVGVKALLSRQGAGYAVAKDALIESAPLAAALCCGLLAEAFECTLALVKAARPSASPLSESQPLELSLADMSSLLDAGRALAWSAAGAVEEGLPEAERLARESKWTASEGAVEGIDSAVRLLGIEGSLRGSTLERLSRDARSAQLLLGPNHIHRIEVARKLLAGK